MRTGRCQGWSVCIFFMTQSYHQVLHATSKRGDGIFSLRRLEWKLFFLLFVLLKLPPCASRLERRSSVSETWFGWLDLGASDAKSVIEIETLRWLQFSMNCNEYECTQSHDEGETSDTNRAFLWDQKREGCLSVPQVTSGFVLLLFIYNSANEHIQHCIFRMLDWASLLMIWLRFDIIFWHVRHHQVRWVLRRCQGIRSLWSIVLQWRLLNSFVVESSTLCTRKKIRYLSCCGILGFLIPIWFFERSPRIYIPMTLVSQIPWCFLANNIMGVNSSTNQKERSIFVVLVWP